MSKFDIDRLDYIMTHPDNIQVLEDKFNHEFRDLAKYMLFSIKIVGNSLLDKYTRAKDGDKLLWDRADVLPDSPFVTYVDDLNNPESWHIYFGLVKPRMVRNFIAVYKTGPVCWNPNKKK